VKEACPGERIRGVRVVGVDACRGGARGNWVAVVLDDGRLTATRLAVSLEQVTDAYPDAAAIGVDMPLGLVERGWREADVLAAARLGAQRSRVFLVPPRAVWEAGSHEEAARRCRTLTDPPAGCSRQAWGLRDKLRPANELYARLPHRLFEVHPELSFAELNGGTPVAAGKKTWNGQMARRTLLGAAGIRLPGDLAEAGTVPPDDVLDAAAVAWSAGRIARGEASSLPDPPGLAGGVPIAIWF
jgi:predicted RNase H-like nuclease